MLQRTMLSLSVLLCLLAGPAYATSNVHTNQIGLQATNWVNSLAVPRFNPSQGTLDRVFLTLSGEFNGMAAFENLDANTALVSLSLAGVLEIQPPGHAPIVVGLPLIDEVVSVDPFDGAIDFGSGSGRTYEHTAFAQTTVELTDLSSFIGSGDITIPAMASGKSEGSGGGNLALSFTTEALAEVAIEYRFTAMPEPATLLLVLPAMAIVCRRRRAGR